jgi:hypothetical protein
LISVSYSHLDIRVLAYEVVAAVHKLAPDLNLTARDMRSYAEGIKVNEVLGMFAAEYWN